MEKVKVEMEVPKEAKEVVDFLDKVLEKVLAKAPLAEYANLLAAAMPAVDGVQDIGEELKSDGRDEIAGYMVQKLMARLLPYKEEEQPSAPVA